MKVQNNQNIKIIRWKNCLSNSLSLKLLKQKIHLNINYVQFVKEKMLSFKIFSNLKSLKFNLKKQI